MTLQVEIIQVDSFLGRQWNLMLSTSCLPVDPLTPQQGLCGCHRTALCGAKGTDFFTKRCKGRTKETCKTMCQVWDMSKIYEFDWICINLWLLYILYDLFKCKKKCYQRWSKVPVMTVPISGRSLESDSPVMFCGIAQKVRQSCQVEWCENPLKF